MDRADRHKTEDLLRTLLVNLIKAGFVADSPVASRWREEGSRAQRELQASSGGEDIHLDTLWTRAIDEAQRDEFVRANESVKPRLQTTCLFALDELTRPDFDFDGGAERIRLSTATG